ncbi:hypothetical protein B566_EDAN015722 [Ephemera danica]|nr:hypothetical protein B566_EDAN015722 [Ephemera danica]
MEKMAAVQSARTISTALVRSSSHGPSAVAGGHGGGWKLWRNLSFLVALPGVAVCMVNAYLRVMEHPHEPPPFVPYDHLRIRNKRFPWGEGQKSLFHNSHMNALPGGYEHGGHH